MAKECSTDKQRITANTEQGSGPLAAAFLPFKVKRRKYATRSSPQGIWKNLAREEKSTTSEGKPFQISVTTLSTRSRPYVASEGCDVGRRLLPV